MKIDKKFFEQLTGSLSKEKIDNEKPEFGNLFKIINSINPHDNKIDVEEITKFAASIWQEDDGDGKTYVVYTHSWDNAAEIQEEILDKVDRVGVNKKLSTDNYIITGFDRTTKQQVAVKRIETMPDGTKQFVITSSENSGVEIRYTESEFNNFGPLTLYKK